jgi:hypothetical protein
MAFPRVLPGWMAGASQPAEVVANDQATLQRAENAVRVLAGGEGVVVPVQPAGHGWHRLHVDVAPTVLGDVVDLLVDAGGGALVGLGSAVEMVLLTLIHAGQAEELLVAAAGLIPVPPGVELGPPEADQVATLAGWLQAVGLPAGRRRVTAERLLADVRRRKGDDALFGMLERLGLRVRDPERWWDELGGATWHFGAMEPPMVGVTRVHWRSQRWAAAQGEDFYGLWDRERPERPAETWPKTGEGRDACERRLHELVVWPILRATRLPGDRRWCTTRHPPRDGGPPTLLGWLAYRSPAGAAALIAAFDPPRTRTLIPAGKVIHVSQSQAAKAGLTGPVDNAGFVLLPNRDLRDVEAAFTAKLGGTQACPWTAVPDAVPDDLLATVAYVREQAAHAATQS